MWWWSFKHTAMIIYDVMMSCSDNAAWGYEEIAIISKAKTIYRGDNDTCDHAEWSYVVKCCDVDACDDVETWRNNVACGDDNTYGVDDKWTSRLEHHLSAPSLCITCIIITAFNNIILCNLNLLWSYVSLSPYVLLVTCLCNVSYMGKLTLLNAVMIIHGWIRRRW